MTAPRNVTVYDTPSGMGGSFTVSIDRDIDPETVEVRVWYGRATPQGWKRWRDWDGYVFTTRRTPSPRNAACRSTRKDDRARDQPTG